MSKWWHYAALGAGLYFITKNSEPKTPAPQTEITLNPFGTPQNINTFKAPENVQGCVKPAVPDTYRADLIDSATCKWKITCDALSCDVNALQKYGQDLCVKMGYSADSPWCPYNIKPDQMDLFFTSSFTSSQ